jgi:2-polyprenyl-6-methoxyphenol hydroxylase-like FAD-dependent oxidoreductase
VLIVGAGLAGLSTAAFLGLHGVEALVVERHPGTSNQPKARGQSPETMEALKVLGLDRAMVAASPSMKLTIIIAESLTGRVYKEILVDAQPDFGGLSPAGGAMASQEAAEPLLLERARSLGAEALFGTVLESFAQDDEGVTAELRDADGTPFTVRADYLVAADGHRGGIRERLGVGTHGRGELGRAASIVFEADLGVALNPESVALYHFQGPDAPGATLVSTDTPGRYALNVSVGDLPDQKRALALIRAATGIPDLDATVLSIARTGAALVIADRFVAGRVLLVGDAAHTMPPTGGQGGNLAVLDGFRLAWRLALVVTGAAAPSLLDGHDTENRPYAEVLAEQQYTALVARVNPAAGGDDVAAPMDPATVLFGYRAPVGGELAGGPAGDGGLFEDPRRPSGRPGTRAPHVAVRHDGREVSTRDLFGRGFVLLAASDGWVQAGVRARRGLPVPLAVHQLDGAWTEVYGVTADGAVLVRPDGVIAWRSTGSGTAEELAAALRAVLGVSE